MDDGIKHQGTGLDPGECALSIRIKTTDRDYIITPGNSNLKTVWLYALRSVVNTNKPPESKALNNSTEGNKVEKIYLAPPKAEEHKMVLSPINQGKLR